MLNTKSAILGVGVALAASALIFASMAVGTTSGAGTDQNQGEDGVVYTAPTPDTGTPPQSEVEQPTTGTTDPSGNQAGAGGAPSGAAGLPETGFGDNRSNSGNSDLIILLGLAGAATLAAGGAVARASRKQ